MSTILLRGTRALQAKYANSATVCSGGSYREFVSFRNDIGVEYTGEDQEKDRIFQARITDIPLTGAAITFTDK